MEVSVEYKQDEKEEYDMCETPTSPLPSSSPPPPPPPEQTPPPKQTPPLLKQTSPPTMTRFSQELKERHQKLFGEQQLWKKELLQHLDIERIKTFVVGSLNQGFSSGTYNNMKLLFKNQKEGMELYVYKEKPVPAFRKYAPEVLNKELGGAVVFSMNTENILQFNFNHSVLNADN
jgi:hypothetical protein